MKKNAYFEIGDIVDMHCGEQGIVVEIIDADWIVVLQCDGHTEKVLINDIWKTDTTVDGKAELTAFFLKVFGYSGVYEEDESDMSCRSKAVKCDRYEVGDKVLIRKWDDMAKQYGFNNYGSIECREKFCKEMKEFCGKVFVISNVDRKHNTYLLKNGDDWTFSTDMFVGKID